MKIFEAIKLANDCGLETLGEAVYNVEIHAIQLFSDSDWQKELNELRQQYMWILNHRRTPDGKEPITDKTSVSMMIQFHIGEDMVDYDMYYSALTHPNLAKRFADE